jgi:hypothetical protein
MNNASRKRGVASIIWEILQMKMGASPLSTPTLAQVGLFAIITDIPPPPPQTLSSMPDTDDANAIREKGTIDLYIIHVHALSFITARPSILYCIVISEKGVREMSIHINFSLTGLSPSQ